MLISLSIKFSSIKKLISTKAIEHGFLGTAEALVTLEKQIVEGANDAKQYLYNLEKRYGMSTGNTLKAKEAVKNADEALDAEKALAKKALNASNFARFEKVWTSLVYGYGRNGDAKAFVDGVFAVMPSSVASIKGIIPNLKQLFARAAWMLSVGTKRRKAIVQGIKNTFTKAVLADPDKLAVMIFHAKKAPGAEVNKILKLASDIPVDLKRIDSMEMFLKFKNKVKTIMTPGKPEFVFRGKKKIRKEGVPIPHNVAALGIEDINKLLDRGGTFTIDSANIMEDLVNFLDNTLYDDYADYARNAINEMIAQGNPLWKEVLIDPIAAAKAYFPRSVKEFGSHVGAYVFDIKKHLARIYQFYHEAMEDLGLKENDNVSTSLSYELFKK
jgi:hypothetical protein